MRSGDTSGKWREEEEKKKRKRKRKKKERKKERKTASSLTKGMNDPDAECCCNDSISCRASVLECLLKSECGKNDKLVCGCPLNGSMNPVSYPDSSRGAPLILRRNSTMRSLSLSVNSSHRLFINHN